MTAKDRDKTIASEVKAMKAIAPRAWGHDGDPVLMEEGVWSLRAHITGQYKAPASKLNSYIAHPCPSTGVMYYWYSLSLIDTECMGCKEHPPEEIMGLWKLHNMDYIQAGHSH